MANVSCARYAPPDGDGSRHDTSIVPEDGGPILAKPLSDVFNMSLATSVVPRQWKAASILPIPKLSVPLKTADYRPISITPVLTRILERIVVKDYIYPSFRCAPTGISFNDQFAFQPTGTGSTTAALIMLLHTVTTLLTMHSFVTV